MYKSRSCTHVTNTEEFIVDILIHVIILSSILSVFFYLIIKPLEEEHLQDEIDKPIVEKIKTTFTDLRTTGNTISVINKYIDFNNATTLSDDNEMIKLLDRLEKFYDKEAPANKNHNKSLVFLNVSGIIIIAAILVTLLVTLRLSSGKCINLVKLIGENILVFIMVGVIEYLFFTHIASSFVPVKPSFIMEVIKNKVDS